MKKTKSKAITPRQFAARQFRKLTAPVNVELLEANGISKASCEAAIARDREYLEMIEPVIQKAAQRSSPFDWKIGAPCRGLKRTLLHSIKIHEKILKLIESSRTAK